MGDSIGGGGVGGYWGGFAEAARGVASLENGIELFEELSAKLGFFVFGLRGGLQRFLRLGFGGVLLVDLCLASLFGFRLLFGGFERQCSDSQG